MNEGDRFIATKTMENMKYKFFFFIFCALHSICDSDGAIWRKNILFSKYGPVIDTTKKRKKWEKKVESFASLFFYFIFGKQWEITRID